MTVFRSRPTAVEAVQVVAINREAPGSPWPADSCFQERPAWLEAARKARRLSVGDGYMWLDVGAGPQSLSEGDWIVCPVGGGIFGMTDDALHALYEAAE